MTSCIRQDLHKRAPEEPGDLHMISVLLSALKQITEYIKININISQSFDTLTKIYFCIYVN
jgi:hypothetical protein